MTRGAVASSWKSYGDSSDGVDDAAPAGAAKRRRGQFEVERLPVGVADYVDGLARAGHEQGQGTRVVTVVGRVQARAVPFDARQSQQLGAG